MAGELARRMYQVPVVPKRQHCFFLSRDFHFAKSHGSSKVLLVSELRQVELRSFFKTPCSSQRCMELISWQSIRLTMDNSAERHSIPEDRVKMGFDGLGSKKCILVKGSGNG